MTCTLNANGGSVAGGWSQYNFTITATATAGGQLPSPSGGGAGGEGSGGTWSQTTTSNQSDTSYYDDNDDFSYGEWDATAASSGTTSEPSSGLIPKTTTSLVGVESGPWLLGDYGARSLANTAPETQLGKANTAATDAVFSRTRCAGRMRFSGPITWPTWSPLKMR